MRDHRRRHVPAVFGHHHRDPIRREDLQRRRVGRLRQRVRVHPQEQRSCDARDLPVFTGRLTDRQDVRLVERVVERRPPMPGGPERHRLRRILRVRPPRIIRRDQARYVDKFRHRFLTPDIILAVRVLSRQDYKAAAPKGHL